VIESIQLRNFQCHSRRTIPLGSVTTIVGPNDVGKSAVIRSLRWVAFNRPTGSSFIRRGQKFASVTLKLSGGDSVARVRGKWNGYKVNGERLKAIGTQVPDQVIKTWKVCEANFQFQHDPHFWLTLSPSALNEALNRIVDLNLLDSASRYVRKTLSEDKVRLKVAQEAVQKAQLKLSEYSRVRAAVKSLRGIQEARRKAAAGREKLQRVEEVLEGIQRRRAVANIPDPPDVPSLTAERNRIESIMRVVTSIHKAKQALATIKQELKTWKLKLSKLPQVKVCEACNRPL
jgi:predicted ATP-dependent endonuclease of OLD family